MILDEYSTVFFLNKYFLTNILKPIQSLECPHLSYLFMVLLTNMTSTYPHK